MFRPRITLGHGPDGKRAGPSRTADILVRGTPASRTAPPTPPTVNAPPTAPLAVSLFAILEGPLGTVLWSLLTLALAGILSTLRAALGRSLPARVLEPVSSEHRRTRLAHLLERADTLSVSAGLYTVICDLLFLSLLVNALGSGGELGLPQVTLAIAIAAPALLLFTETLPAAIARAWGDQLLVRALPTFYLAQLPVAWIVVVLEALRGALLRALGIHDDASASRKLVEGLREVAEGADSVELEPSERELIENVLDFKGVDAAEVMTPRTEVHAAPIDASMDDAAQVFAEAGHSRIPVYEDSVDNIVGTVSSLEVTKALAEGRLESVALRDLVRPPLLVPETKLVSELLKEFRAEKQKMAIVVDEYGGTAGLVTLTDVLEELVGEIPDEYEEAEEGVRELGDGLFEVQAGLHVSEVNEVLGLDIPEEEDFETLGGFVLAELGRLPREGESFAHQEVTFSVAEASDRRVLKVRVQRSA
jgi:magnesium and cobalt exporter, CNNM family